MASLMLICPGLVGPKSENVEKPQVLKAFLKGSKERGGIQEYEVHSEPGRLEGGRGRVNPFLVGLFWRFWRFWKFWRFLEVWRVWFIASTRLEARGLGGLISLLLVNCH